MSEAQLNSGFGGAGDVAGTPRKIGFIHPASFFHLADLADPVARAFELRDLYAPQLTWESVADLDSLYVAARHRPDTVVDVVAPVVRRFLAEGQGRKVFIDGENRVGDWLDGTSEEPRECVFWAWRTGQDTLRRSQHQDHHLWSYLSEETVHWHHHASLLPPSGAVPLVALVRGQGGGGGCGAGCGEAMVWGGAGAAGVAGHGAGGVAGAAAGTDGNAPADLVEDGCILYYDGVTFPAEVVVSAMDATYHHGAGFMPGATQLFYRMLRWLSAPAGC